MDHSRFIAGLVGPVLIAVAVSLLLNPGLIAALAEDLSSSPGLMLTSGVLALIAGLAITRTHNVWKGWPAAITVLGWLAVVGGVTRIVLPDLAGQIAVEAARIPGAGLAPFAGGVALLIGLFFTWQGWIAGAPAPVDES